MSEYRWLNKDMVLAIHEMQIAQFGGASGIRDDGLLESALARPQNLAAYGEPTVPEMAAAYAFGVARNHPFVDGNKRTAFVAAYTFLRMNGLQLAAPEEAVVITFQDLAAGDIEEAQLAAWIADHAGAR